MSFLNLKLKKFSWITKELVPANLEKAGQGGYKWQRKDGSWWTNVGGQVVPYSAQTHGEQEHSELAGQLHDDWQEAHRQADAAQYQMDELFDSDDPEHQKQWSELHDRMRHKPKQTENQMREHARAKGIPQEHVENLIDAIYRHSAEG